MEIHFRCRNDIHEPAHWGEQPAQFSEQPDLVLPAWDIVEGECRLDEIEGAAGQGAEFSIFDDSIVFPWVVSTG
ncbi:MAG: hypothetical protein P8Y94_14890 [Acidobacteriota bacterium]